ncbi:MAG: hypothetical protein ACREX8_17550 [Gammaproteobacteria bacterium]
MASGLIASFAAALALGYAEGMGRFYPAHKTWLRLRSRHGRRAVRAMRERFEGVATSRIPRILAIVLLGLVVGWILSASLLDKRWYEVVMDVLPYGIVGVTLLRTPAIMRKIAERIRDYERDIGEDPERELLDDPGDGGPTAIAL